MKNQKLSQKITDLRIAISKVKVNKRSLVACAALTALVVYPNLAHAQFSSVGGLSFPILDDLFCGFITYSKGKLAPYVAVSAVIAGVIGHWLGAAKIWGTLLYVALGIGLIMGIGVIIASATGAAATCLASSF